MPGCNQEKEEEIVLGPDFEAAANEKALTVDIPLDLPLLDEQPSHQETAEHKEDVDPYPAGIRDMQQMQGVVEQAKATVVEVHDQQDGDAAHEIEFDLASKWLFNGRH